MWRELLFLYCSRELIQWQSSATVVKFTGEQISSQGSNYQQVFIADSRKRDVMLSDAVELGVFLKEIEVYASKKPIFTQGQSSH